jgi:RHS repeat-associated protein
VVNILASEETTVDLALDLLALDDTRNPHPVRFDGAPPEHEPLMLASLMDISGILNQSVVAATGPDALYWFINDHLGTPQKVIDGDQAVVWEGSQEPFGNTTVTTNTLGNNFRFPGQYFDTESGLHYNYHRYYDPSIGRYLRADPIGLVGGINLYPYVENNPANLIDPTGEIGLPGAVLGAALGATAGFTSGITSGNPSAGFWSGVAGAVAGGTAGLVVGIIAPNASPVVGGIVGGLVGGATASGVNVRLTESNCADSKDYAIASLYGALKGAIFGAIGGGIVSSAATVGATGVAVETAASLITMPVGLGVDVAFSDLLF